MSQEIETKFKLASPGEMRKGLKKIGAKLISKGLERDIYYAVPVSLRLSVIRLRAIGKKGLFTLKSGGSGMNEGPYKIRRERETGIDNAGMFETMLKALGLQVRFRKEKLRETYAWQDAKICIDQLPYIGWYVEIEAPKADIRKLAGLFGLDMQKAMSDNYMQLFKYYKLAHQLPDLELVFPKKSKSRNSPRPA
jgi:predicted adenylyl cyclase CyaB